MKKNNALRAVNTALDVIAEQPVSLTPLRMLCLLAQHAPQKMTTTDLATRLDIHRSNIGQMARLLESQGWINRESEMRGQTLKNHKFTLTPTGMERVEGFVKTLTGGSKKG